MQTEHSHTGTKVRLASSSQGASAAPNSARLGGARADFVAGLGRKVADLRTALAAVKTSEDDVGARDELRRKLHALGKSAKMMKCDAMDRGIAEAVGTLDRAKRDARLDEADVDAIETIIEDLPALAWGDNSVRPARPNSAEKAAAPKYRVLVVGASAIGDALLDDESARSTFICESTPDAQAAYDLVRTTEPDLIVLDADVSDALELVDALMDDSVTEAVPIVVVGSFLEPSEAARYVAMGVAKTVGKPTTRETLRAACEETLAPERTTSNAHVLLGEPTLEQLGDRLAAELRDAIVGRADPAGRGVRIPLGQGTEVLGAVWGAIARIREVVTSRSDGAIRFAGGPEGAFTPAPLLCETESARSDRGRRPRRTVGAEAKLEGRRIIIADDDPAVVWFLADLLRTAGCFVQEAFDGKEALELAHATAPDLVISDILMPNVDGFSLCRSLRRDVALRDTPVILLSWKEDLLQRVRELGAGAAGYVRKESDTRAIMARVREALQTRGRIEARLQEDGEVRGRLDGISIRTLLEIVCAMRPDARVSVRDASFLYEVEVRSGRPYRVTRTDGDGGFLKGEQVLAQLLGVSAGRFYVTASNSEIEAELQGSLAEQLSAPIRKARAVTALVTAQSSIARLRFDEEALPDYLKATPERAQLVIRRLANGAAPSELVLCGGCDAAFLEDLLCDVAARGLIVDIEDAEGKTLLPVVASEQIAFELPIDPALSCTKDEGSTICESPNPGGASSLEDAVLREVQHRSPEPSSAILAAEEPSIIDPKELRLRSSLPPAYGDEIVPGADDVVIVAERTVIDDTIVYGEESSLSAEPAPVLEHANAVGAAASEAPVAPVAEEAPEEAPALLESAKQDSLTPFDAVTVTESEDSVPGLEKRKRWPMVAFVTATGIVAWAVLHFSISSAHAPKQHERQLEAPASEMPLPPPAASSDVSSTPVAPTAVPTGHGEIDVSAPDGAAVVDGKERARGSVKVHAPSGNHEVRGRQKSSDERGCTIDVRSSHTAR